MTIILCIETATPICSVALIRDRELIDVKESSGINSHSEILTVFIEEILTQNGIKPSALDAIAVSKGPGSYTGLRIGVSVAKGLCYGTGKPMIAVNTLQSMAFGMIKQKDQSPENSLFCPMIDARRMEVYSALFDPTGKQARETKAEIIRPDSFKDLFNKHRIIFFGDGADKCRNMIDHPNAEFITGFKTSAAFMIQPALQKFELNDFEDTAYFEPFYLKDFIAGVPRVKGLK